MLRVSDVLLGGKLDLSVLEAAERSTFVEVDDAIRQYSSFVLRLIAATVIATAGIAADSATTVIGAMLVAPLMSPMLGTALAAAVGRPADAVRTFFQTALGMLLVVVVAIGVTSIIPAGISMDTNSQVISRISPSLVDMTIAFAAGFVAALAAMRSDIPDAVPGVAISASIVPPLCVMGAGIYEGSYAAALGAFTLFLTNYVAIQAMGAVVFLLMGLGSKRLTAADERSRTMWYGLVAISVVALVALLGGASMRVARETERDRAVRAVATEWAGDSGYRISQLDIVGDDLFIEVSGSGDAPSAHDLDDELDREGVEFDRVSVAVRLEETSEG